MTRLSFLWFAAVVAVLLAAGTAYKLTRTDDAGAPAFAGARAAPVSVHEVERVAFADVVEALGTARANESVTITSKLTDVIGALEFDSGDTVAAGDVLATLADAEEAATLTEARATYQEAVRERDRFEELEARGVAPRQTVDELNSSLTRAQARVQSIEARLADRVVRAPFDGVIGLRNASPGMLVRPGDVIATLDDVSVIKVDFTVPEPYVAAMRAGSEIEASAAAYPGETVRGEVTNVEVVRNARESLAAPELSLVLQGDQTFVYVVEQGETGLVVRRRDVKTAARSDGLVEITDGLEAGERVVSEGTHRLREGMPVMIPEERPTLVSGLDGSGA